MLILHITTVLLLLLAHFANAINNDDDEVLNLPGLSWKPTFRQYSGYLKATGTRRLHYWFVECDCESSSAPVVLWMNGGPGCSSLDGFLSEHGPFLISNDGVTLTKNEFSWNKVANMLYLEAPAGVGYSYSADQNYTTSDDQTSLDNYWALKNFFSRYSQFTNNAFFITGESYAGIYVPTLAVRIAQDKQFNFKGFAVGNGLSDVSLNSNSAIYFYYHHGLIGSELWMKLIGSCCKDANSTIGNCDFSSSTSVDCVNNVDEANAAIGDINIYNIYEDCTPQNTAARHVPMFLSPYSAVATVTEICRDNITCVLHPHHLGVLPAASHVKLLHHLSGMVDGSVLEVPPCINVSAITTYLNTPAVKDALHIAPKLPAWQICNGNIDYHRQYDSMRSQYLDILNTRVFRVLVYNGDVDLACNFLGDEWFVDSLHLKLVTPRKPWFFTGPDGSQQIGGYAKQFNNLTFVTVRGSGHMVPQDKPAPAFVMFKHFIDGTPF